MQQSFSCPACGSQNAIDQQFCGACGTRLVANCPWCGLEQAPGQRLCKGCGVMLGATPQDREPSMHILPLDQYTKSLLGFTSRGQPGIFTPTVTEDGRVALLLAGENIKSFGQLQKDIDHRIEGLGRGYESYVCVGVPLMPVEDRRRAFLVYEVVGGTQPIGELQHLHDMLASLKVGGYEYWNEVQSYFASEPRRFWINTMIRHLRQELNWAEYVDRAIAMHGMQ